MSKNSFTLNDFVFNQMIIWLLNILFVILMIKLEFFFLDRILCKKMKRGQSKAQQQYIQGFFKKKPCQRQVDAVQCSAGQSQSTRQGQVGQQISSREPGSTGQRGPVRTTPAAIYLQQQNRSNFYKKFTRHSTLSVWTMKEVENKYCLLSGFYL